MNREQRYLAAQKIIAWLWAVFLVLFLLLGCSSEKREHIYDTDQCYQQDKRAVMLCDSAGRCFIECRDKRDG